MPEPLSIDEVRHVATLARLRLSDTELEQYRGQLSSVLDHIATLNGVDVESVEPMSHPLDLTNRLADDVVGDAMSLEDLHRNAPATEDRFLAVPKVLEDTGG